MNKSYGATSSTDVSVLGDRSQEFNNLCDNVVSNIYSINSSLKKLSNLLKNIGTPRDNQGLRNSIHVLQLSTNEIASVTSKDLNKLIQLVIRSEKSQKLQVEKLEENFKGSITKYHQLQKELVNKQKQHLLVAVFVENNDNLNDEDNIEQQQKELLIRKSAFEQDMLAERESRIRQIEADVLDINQIMRELGIIVYKDAEVIDRIENRIDYTVGNLEEGKQQLIEATRHHRKYKRRLLFLILIGLIILAIIIVIIILETKH